MELIVIWDNLSAVPDALVASTVLMTLNPQSYNDPNKPTLNCGNELLFSALRVERMKGTLTKLTLNLNGTEYEVDDDGHMANYPDELKVSTDYLVAPLKGRAEKRKASK